MKFQKQFLFILFCVCSQFQLNPSLAESTDSLTDAGALSKLANEIRLLRAQAPIIKLTISRESQFSGFWNSDKVITSKKMTGTLVAEAIPEGRFSAEVVNYPVPKDLAVDDELSYERRILSYDGKSYFTVDLPLDDPRQGVAYTGSATVSNEDKFAHQQINDFFPIVALTSFRFRSITGPVDGLSNNSINIRMDGDVVILETSAVPGTSGFQKEILWVRASAGLQPFKYSNRLVNSSGVTIEEESWIALEFSGIKNTIFSFPKKVERVFTRTNPSDGKRTVKKDIFVVETCSIQTNSDSLFSPKLKPGYSVRDERLGISFRVGNMPSDIYKGLERISKP